MFLPYFPGTHARQTVDPASTVIEPAWQTSHVSAPGCEANFPLSHSLQEETVSRNLPLSHAVHVVLPVWVFMYPGLHVVQVVAPFNAVKDPSAQR